MTVCTTKRVYEDKALECWTEVIDETWRKNFTPQEMRLGEEIHANGEIRELEINETNIIANARFDQENCYSMIEWDKKGIKVRVSCDDKLLGNALAVAGLLDFEALLTELNVDQAAPEEDPSAKNSEDAIRALLNRKKKNEETIVECRKLAVQFELKTSGLFYTAFWENPDGKQERALKSKNYDPKEANAMERERLIALASMGRKSGFKFNAEKGYYHLEKLEDILKFYKDDFENGWAHKFEYQGDAGFLRLEYGIQEPELLFDVQAIDDDAKMDFSWLMSSEDVTLAPEAVLQLIKKSGKPQIIPDMGILMLSPEKVELLATWKRWLNLYNDGLIPRYVLFSLFGEESIQLTLSKDLKSWRESLFKLPDDSIKTDKFLRNYQEQGVRWLWHICEKNCHGLLADEMGLGKTVQVLSFIHSRKAYKLPNLVVCPASVVPVWKNEAKRFFPKSKVEILKSGNDFSKDAGNVLWVASYAQLRMHKYLLPETNFGYVVLDEAQLIKNPDAKVTKACMCIRGKSRIVLSGTPLENRYLDLWTIFRFLMPGLLGTRKAFEKTVNDLGADIGEKLRKQIAPFVLRRTKEDVLKELPNKTEIECVCPLSETQKKVYEKLVKEGMKDLGDNLPEAVKKQSISFLTLLTRLRQACCDPKMLPDDMPQGAKDEMSGKIKMLISKLEEVLSGGRKVVIFSQFVSFLEIIEREIKENFPDMPIFKLTGKTQDREKPVDDFQKLQEEGIMLVCLRAGGTGITLNSADYVFLMDPWWNPAVEEQAIDRVHRIGQTKPVFVYRMVTTGTIEARIQNLKNEKRDMAKGVLGEMSDITNIKNYFQSLSDLIALLPEEN